MSNEHLKHEIHDLATRLKGQCNGHHPMIVVSVMLGAVRTIIENLPPTEARSAYSEVVKAVTDFDADLPTIN